MAIHAPTDLPALLGRGQRLLGLDLGKKTIGVAVSDPGLTTASPVGTIRRTKLANDLRELAREMRDWDCGGLVIGMPLNMDGTYGPSADRSHSFADSLLTHADLLGGEPRITFWDERLTSFEAEDRLREAQASRRVREASVDAVAAAVILQNYLDSLPR